MVLLYFALIGQENLRHLQAFPALDTAGSHAFSSNSDWFVELFTSMIGEALVVVYGTQTKTDLLLFCIFVCLVLFLFCEFRFQCKVLYVKRVNQCWGCYQVT